MHVTLRAHRSAPSFRSELVAAIAREVFDEIAAASLARDERVRLARWARARREAGLSDDARREEERGEVEGPDEDGWIRTGSADQSALVADEPPSGPALRLRPYRHPRTTDEIAAGFHVLHYSLQRDHVHLIVEADDARVLSLGLRRVVIRLAKRINMRVRRATRGKVWGDRYHRRDLPTPREVRSALVYVLHNGRRHGEVAADGLDPFSSVRLFEQWKPSPRAPPSNARFVHGWRAGEPLEVLAPKTWLLDRGWQRAGGRLDVLESPAALRAA